MRRPLLALLVVALAGCYQPSPGDCQFRCDVGGACPSGLSCDNGLCTHDRASHHCSCTAASCAVSGQACDPASLACVDFVDCAPGCASDSDCPADGLCDNGRCTHRDGGPRCACDGALCAARNLVCDGVSDDCRPCREPPLPDLRADVWVGSDVPSRLAAAPYCPYGTLTAALAGIAQAGHAVTVHAAAGRYDAGSGEHFPLVLRGDVHLVGAGADQTIVEGAGVVNVGDSAFAQRLQTSTFVIGDAVGSVQLSGLTMRTGESGIAFGSSAIYCDRGNAPPLGTPARAGNSDVRNVSIGPGYEYGVIVTNSGDSGCNLTLAGSTIANVGRGLWSIGCGLGAPTTTAVAATVGDGSPGGGNQFSDIHGGGSDMGGDDGVAVAMWDCTQRLVVQGNVFTRSGVGVSSGVHARQQPLVVLGNQFIDLVESGISAHNLALIEELDDNLFTGIRGGVRFFDDEAGALVLTDQAQVLQGRRNQFLGNNFGVRITGDPPSPARVLDFGTSGSDPGANVFRCNSRLDGDIGFDLWLQLTAPGTQPLAFVGNGWDHVPPTRAALPNAPDGTDIADGSTVPAGIAVEPSTGASVACPAGSMTTTRWRW